MRQVWHQGGQREETFRRSFDRAMDGMVHRLLQVSEPSGLAYVADLCAPPLPKAAVLLRSLRFFSPSLSFFFFFFSSFFMAFRILAAAMLFDLPVFIAPVTTKDAAHHEAWQTRAELEQPRASSLLPTVRQGGGRPEA